MMWGGHSWPTLRRIGVTSSSAIVLTSISSMASHGGYSKTLLISLVQDISALMIRSTVLLYLAELGSVSRVYLSTRLRISPFLTTLCWTFAAVGLLLLLEISVRLFIYSVALILPLWSLCDASGKGGTT